MSDSEPVWIEVPKVAQLDGCKLEWVSDIWERVDRWDKEYVVECSIKKYRWGSTASYYSWLLDYFKTIKWATLPKWHWTVPWKIENLSHCWRSSCQSYHRGTPQSYHFQT
jgi:hypothetical protein